MPQFTTLWLSKLCSPSLKKAFMIIQVTFIRQVPAGPSGLKFSTFTDRSPPPKPWLFTLKGLAPRSPLLYTPIAPSMQPSSGWLQQPSETQNCTINGGGRAGSPPRVAWPRIMAFFPTCLSWMAAVQSFTATNFSAASWRSSAVPHPGCACAPRQRPTLSGPGMKSKKAATCKLYIETCAPMFTER